MSFLSALQDFTVKFANGLFPKKQVTVSGSDIAKNTISESTPGIGLPTAQRTVMTNGQTGIMIQKDYIYDGQTFDYIEHQAIYNRHLAKAMSNFGLANTKQIISFDPKVSAKNKAVMLAHLESVRDSWFDGGYRALEKTMTTEGLVGGAIACEGAMRKNMKGIEIINFLTHSQVDIRKNETGRSEYYQVGYSSTKLGQGFIYSPYRRTATSARGLSAFLGAVNDLLMQDDLDASVRAFVKKIGAFGLMMATIKPPQPVPGCDPVNTPQAYKEKCQAMINEAYEQLKNQLSESIVIGFDREFTFNIGGAADAANAQAIIDIVKKQLITGLMQDLNFMNEPGSATDAYSKVLLKIFAEDLENIQQMKAMPFERLYWIELVSMGYSPISITVEYESPDIRDKKVEQETQAIQIANLSILVEKGIIDRTDMALELGYNEPKVSDEEQAQKEKEKAEQENPTAAPSIGSPAPKEKESKKTKANNAYRFSLDRVKKENQFPFVEGLVCGTEAFGKKSTFTKLISDYEEDIRTEFDKAAKKSMKDVKAEIAQYKGVINTNDLLKSFVITFINSFNKAFTIDTKVRKHVLKAYTHFRKDKTAIGAKSNMSYQTFAEDYPEAAFNLLDYKLIEYLQDSDIFYLGKFINDPKAIENFRAKIINYVELNGEISQGSVLLDSLFEEFEDMVSNQKWKIAQIVNTTINNSRGSARVQYMSQVGIEKYVWIEVMDRLTCQHCQAMHGKEFTVENAVSKLKTLADSNPEDVASQMQFGTNVPIDEFTKKSSDQLMSMGIGIMSVHPNCRRTVEKV